MNRWIELEQRYYMHCANRQPVVIEHGQGSYVWDTEGVKYLDFTAGWASDSLGHCPPVMVEAINRQSSTLLQTSNQFYTLPQLHLAELLVENSCLDKVFLCNSGAEANEGAIKLARKYGKIELDGAFEIIVADNSFHGRTLTTVAATGNPHYQESFTPMTPGFVHVEYSDIGAIKRATTNGTCAVMLEPVQGEGGVIVPSPHYLKEVRAWCDERGLLLILDEVQTGMGRIGTLFGYQYFGIEPDVMTLAKGMGGGVPIGAILTKERCNVLRPGDHGSTFGGNALTSAAAYAVCRSIVEDGIIDNVEPTGNYLKTALLEPLTLPNVVVKEVRGLGLLIAVQFTDPIAGLVVSSCNDLGLLLNPVRPDTVRFMPPLNVSYSEIDEALGKFRNALGIVDSGI